MDGDIRKSDIRQFLDDLEKQAHTLYATVLALPESLFWIVQEDTEQTFSVAGFIENEGRNFKFAGLWKVYCNECETLRLFAKFEKCKNVYRRLWREGRSVLQLTVAV